MENGHLRKLSKMQKRKGSFWITNGENSRRVYNVSDIPEGYYKGRIIKRKTL